LATDLCATCQTLRIVVAAASDSLLLSLRCVALRCVALGVVVIVVAVRRASATSSKGFFFVVTRRNGRYKTTKKIADFGYEKRRVATMNFGVAEKVILGKYHLAFHSKKNMCRKKSRGMKILGMKNYAAGKGLRHVGTLLCFRNSFAPRQQILIPNWISLGLQLRVGPSTQSVCLAGGKAATLLGATNQPTKCGILRFVQTMSVCGLVSSLD
jgi:hypothetical protein